MPTLKLATLLPSLYINPIAILFSLKVKVPFFGTDVLKGFCSQPSFGADHNLRENVTYYYSQDRVRKIDEFAGSGRTRSRVGWGYD